MTAIRVGIKLLTTCSTSASVYQWEWYFSHPVWWLSFALTAKHRCIVFPFKHYAVCVSIRVVLNNQTAGCLCVLAGVWQGQSQRSSSEVRSAAAAAPDKEAAAFYSSVVLFMFRHSWIVGWLNKKKGKGVGSKLFETKKSSAVQLVWFRFALFSVKNGHKVVVKPTVVDWKF